MNNALLSDVSREVICGFLLRHCGSADLNAMEVWRSGANRRALEIEKSRGLHGKMLSALSLLPAAALSWTWSLSCRDTARVTTLIGGSSWQALSGIWIGGVWNGHFRCQKNIFQRPKFTRKSLKSHRNSHVDHMLPLELSSSEG